MNLLRIKNGVQIAVVQTTVLRDLRMEDSGFDADNAKRNVAQVGFHVTND